MSAGTVEKKQSVALVAQSDMDRIDELDAFCKASATAIILAHESGSDMQRALITARATNGIKSRLTKEIMADVMALQGTKLGYKTDRDDKGGYSVDVVRDVLTEALIRRLRVCGNEFNIIAGSLYVTKEGLKRLVSEHPGLSDLEIDMGVPIKASETTALVPCVARWKYNGQAKVLECQKTEELDARIPVRVNQYMGMDAIAGKAESKLYRRMYNRLTGSTISSAEDDDLPTIAAEIGTEVAVAVADGEILDCEFTVTPEALPDGFAAELREAMAGIQTETHRENVLAFWVTRAKRVGMSAGQIASIEAMVAGVVVG